MRFISTFLFCLMALDSPCSAEMIFDNFGGAYSGVSYATTTDWVAAKFTTDSQAYHLDSIQLDLDNQIPSPESGTIMLHLFSSNLTGTAPFADTGAIFPATFVTTPSYVDTYVTFSPSTPVILSPNTSYWAVLSVVSGDAAIGWTGSLSPQPSGVAGVFGRNLSNNSGANWVGYDPLSNYKMQIQATNAAVPEPSSFGLLGLGGIVLAINGYRRGRASAARDDRPR